jgi:hypothetical protein
MGESEGGGKEIALREHPSRPGQRHEAGRLLGCSFDVGELCFVEKLLRRLIFIGTSGAMVGSYDRFI